VVFGCVLFRMALIHRGNGVSRSSDNVLEVTTSFRSAARNTLRTDRYALKQSLFGRPSFLRSGSIIIARCRFCVWAEFHFGKGRLTLKSFVLRTWKPRPTVRKPCILRIHTAAVQQERRNHNPLTEMCPVSGSCVRGT
jgi:hypothetical protein